MGGSAPSQIGYCSRSHRPLTSDFRPLIWGESPLPKGAVPPAYLEIVATPTLLTLSLDGRGEGEGEMVFCILFKSPSPYPLPQGEGKILGSPIREGE